jgi:zinc transporter 2
MAHAHSHDHHHTDDDGHHGHHDDYEDHDDHEHTPEERTNPRLHISEDLEDARERRNVLKRLYMAAFVCGCFIMVEVAGGLWAHSLAILSDAAHLFADLASFAVAIAASYLASKPATRQHTFGLRRTESLAALFSMVSLAFVSVGLGYEAICRLINPPEELVEGKIMSGIASIGVMVNIALAAILGEHHVHLPGMDHSHDHDHGGGSCGGHHGHAKHAHDNHAPDNHAPAKSSKFLQKKSRGYELVSYLKDVENAGGGQSHHDHGHHDAPHRGCSHHHDHSRWAKRQGHVEMNGDELPVDPGQHDYSHSPLDLDYCGLCNNELSVDSGHHNLSQSANHHDHVEMHDGELPVDPDHHDHAHSANHQDHCETFHDEPLEDVVSSHREHDQRNINLRAAYLHVMADLAQSVALLIAGLVIWVRPDWHVIDPILTLLFACLVLYSTIGVLRLSASVLLEATPPNLSWRQVYKAISQVPNVHDVHDLHIWSISHGIPTLSVHCQSNDPMALRRIRDQCLKFGISQATIQIQRVAGKCLTCGDSSVSCTRHLSDLDDYCD